MILSYEVTKAHAPLKLLPARFHIFGKMEASMCGGEVLVALFVESGMSSEEKDSGFWGRGDSGRRWR